MLFLFYFNNKYLKILTKFKKKKHMNPTRSFIYSLSYDRTIFVENYIELTCEYRYSKYKHSLFTEFVPFLLKNGKKLTLYNRFSDAISTISNNIMRGRYIKANYTFYEQFSFYYKTSNKVKTFNYLLDWYYRVYNPVFDVKCFSKPKKKKEKGVNKTYKIIFIPEKLRSKIISKHLASYIRSSTGRGLGTRLELVFCDLFFNYRSSFLFKRKIAIYKKLISLR